MWSVSARALGAGAIVRVGAAYRLTVQPEALDVARFRQQLALGNIEAALVEWTGIPLAGLEAPGLTPVVDGLVEQWLATVEIDLEHRLQTNPTATIGPLTELTANHPFREGLWSLLMTALYRVGRQADALDAYQKARHHLVEQLGVEPGPRLRELESLILGQDEQLRGPERPRHRRHLIPRGPSRSASARWRTPHGCGRRTRRRWPQRWPASTGSFGPRWTATAGASSPRLARRSEPPSTEPTTPLRGPRAAAGGEQRTMARRCGAAAPDRAAHRGDRGTSEQLLRRGRERRQHGSRRPGMAARSWCRE